MENMNTDHPEEPDDFVLPNEVKPVQDLLLLKVQAGLAAFKDNVAYAKNTNKNARGAYYNEALGLKILEIINEVHQAGRPKMIYPQGIQSVSTLRLKWYQGRQWLIDHFAHNKEINTLLNSVRCKQKDTHIVIVPLDENGHAIVPRVDWQTPFLLFISTPQELMTKFQHFDSFTINDIAWAREKVLPVRDKYLLKMNEHMLLCLRMNQGAQDQL